MLLLRFWLSIHGPFYNHSLKHEAHAQDIREVSLSKRNRRLMLITIRLQVGVVHFSPSRVRFSPWLGFLIPPVFEKNCPCSFPSPLPPGFLHALSCGSQGSFGRVYHAVWLGTDIAVKVMSGVEGAALVNVWREVVILRKLRHPNVVLFIGAVEVQQSREVSVSRLADAVAGAQYEGAYLQCEAYYHLHSSAFKMVLAVSICFPPPEYHTLL